MSVRTLGALQWVALLLGALVWAAQHVIGFGITQAECGLGGKHWGLANDVWELTTMSVSALLILVALALSLLVYVRTNDTHYDDEPPESRIRMLAIAAMPVNVVVLMIVLLDGFASAFHVVCRQA